MQQTMALRTSLSKALVVLVVVLGLGGGSSGQHRRSFPQPPPPSVVPDQPAPEAKPMQRLDTFTMEREAHELSALAASVPGDVDQLKKGMLPKDAVDKLKRIEKLSRQLRGQIRP